MAGCVGGQDLSEVGTAGNGPAILYVRTRSQSDEGLSVGESDRRTQRTYTICYEQPPCAPDDYLIQTLRTIEKAAQDGASGLVFKSRGRTETLYDQTTRLPIATKRWQNASTVAVTERAFDPQTGNLVSRTKPEQASADGSGASTTLAYDPHRLFVARAIDELGQETQTDVNVATGVLVERRGPNFVTIGQDKVWERETWTIDGLGRVLEHRISLDDPDAGYVLALVDTTEYRDRAFVDDGEPVSMRSQQPQEFGSDVWTIREHTFDGLGRMLTDAETLAQGQLAVRAYAYDGRGNLAAVEVPDPRVDDGSRVSYERAYDGLGRITRLTRPDDTGLSVAYQGLERTIREVTGDDSGSTHVERRDVFGRLQKVRALNPEAEDAITRYRYDIHDNLREIVNPDGDITELRHDWLSNRMAITRGERTWTYAYDLNGNLEREVAPLPDYGSPPAETEYVYDDLNRIISLQSSGFETHPAQPPFKTINIPMTRAATG